MSGLAVQTLESGAVTTMSGGWSAPQTTTHTLQDGTSVSTATVSRSVFDDHDTDEGTEDYATLGDSGIGGLDGLGDGDGYGASGVNGTDSGLARKGDAGFAVI